MSLKGNRVLTLEQTAHLLWISEGKPKAGPISHTAVRKIEKRALQKVKAAIIKNGGDINNYIPDSAEEDFFIPFAVPEPYESDAFEDL